MFRDRSEHLQAFLAEGFIHLGVLLNPRVDPYYLHSSGQILTHENNVRNQ